MDIEVFEDFFSFAKNVKKISFANELAKLRKMYLLPDEVQNVKSWDKTINNDYNGIKVVNIIDWLLLDE